MPGKVGVKIKAGRNLPVMDRGSDTTDAYVEIKLGNVTHKTDVCRKTLNPQWNTDWFRFEVDDAELQDEPLQIRLMDHDTYSANDAIGKVNISLNPLCIENAGQSNQGKGAVMSGWIPVFDTMHGIRGEVNIIVKVDLFSDANKFRQSSCGVQFFHSPCVPHGYRAQIIHGFVEELVVNDDPEYQWIDKIRTPRASNEARQVVFLKLSGQVQRKIGLKAINLGANAVIGYTQCFDLEGDVGVVARGIGTAVTLVKIQEISTQPVVDNALIEERTLKYLEFLKGSGSSYENYRSIFDNDSFDGGPGNVVYKILGIEPMDKSSTKAPNVILKKQWKPGNKNTVIPEEVIGENDGLRQLLQQEDMRGEKTSRRFKHHYRKFKNTSKLFNDKFNVFKTKMLDDKLDGCSLTSSYSDISYTESIRSSLTDLRSYIRLKKKKDKKIDRSISDGSAMASILVSSILHGPSLDSISEGHDSVRSTPKSVKLKEIKDKKSESMGNLSQQNIKRKNFLSAELRQKAILKSDISISSASIISSTTEEEGFSDENSETTPPNEIVVVDADTVSMVVKSVLAQESIDKESENWIEPIQRDITLSDIVEEDHKLNIHHITHNNSFSDNEKLNISTGATRILKVDKSDKITESTIIEKETTRSSFNILCKTPSEDEDAEKWIEPGSTTDEPETIDKERRGSLLHELKENISEKIHLLQGHMHMPHFTDDRDKLHKKALMEATKCAEEKKLGKPSGDDINVTNTNQKPEKRRGSLDILTRKLHFPFCHKKEKSDSEIKTDYGLIGTAMKTILLDDFNLIDEIGHSSPNTPDIITNNDDLSQIDTKEISIDSNDQNNANMKATKMDFCIPKITLPTIQKSIETSYYSSQPELNQSTISPTTLGMPFVSLTNLNVSTSSFSSQTTNSINIPSEFPNSPIIGLPSKFINPKNRLLPSDTVTKFDNARSNVLSSSYTNLSTNKAPLLAPFPCLKHSRSELATATASPGGKVISGHIRTESVGCKVAQSPAKIGNSAPTGTVITNKDAGIHRRSSDSDLSVTPKGNSICIASERLVAATNMMRLNAPASLKAANQENLDMLEYPFLTMARYPPGFILHLGATVAARSVKLLERVPNPDEPETRDSWWTELRMEIRSHARALGCNVILGYSEVTTISDDVCVLSATGTAAVINMTYNGNTSQFDLSHSSKKDLMVSSLEEKDILKDIKNCIRDFGDGTNKECSTSLGTGTKNLFANSFIQNLGCSMCHIPYSQSSVPFNVKMRKCAVCKRGKVPDVILATIEIPENLLITGRGCFMQAQVVRAKKDLRSESNAKEISDGLPFLEYELHRLLINKLKAKGMNAIFALKAHVAIGEKMMALIATGTAVYLSALPPPTVPKIVAGNSWNDTAKLNELQKSLQETYERNREIYQLKSLEPLLQNGKQSDTDDSEDEIPELDLNTGNKDTCVLEVDDIEDLEIISLLMEPCPPEGFHVVNTQTVPGIHDMEVVRNLQMFTQIWRAKLSVGQSLGNFPKHFQRLLQTVYFKLRSMIPCAICDLRFRLDLPDSDEIQLLVTGMALGLGEPSKLTKLRRKVNATNGVASNENTPLTNGHVGNGKKSQDEELIFNLEEDSASESSPSAFPMSNANYGSHSFRLRKTSPSRTKFNSVRLARHTPLRDRYGVDITPLSYVPGGKIEKYLGNLNFFFIRESTSIRENGGISGFVHSFITELLAVVRAHISALGGNAMVSFYMTELILVDNQHKNQGQCLISIGGDVVYVSYFSDD